MNVNETLFNNIVSFEQLGPGVYPHSVNSNQNLQLVNPFWPRDQITWPGCSKLLGVMVLIAEVYAAEALDIYET